MRSTAIFLAIAFGMLPGCSGGLGPDANIDVAATALQTAMEAWKNGKTQDDLENGQPSIVMNEDNWRIGKRLVAFKADQPALVGRQVRCRVTITLEEKSGKKVEQRALYIIDTTPRIVIVRDTFATSTPPAPSDELLFAVSPARSRSGG